MFASFSLTQLKLFLNVPFFTFICQNSPVYAAYLHGIMLHKIGNFVSEASRNREGLIDFLIQLKVFLFLWMNSLCVVHCWIKLCIYQ